MSIFNKSLVLGLGLVAGIAATASAQQGPSVASLPGPRASSEISIPGPDRQAVVPTGNYPGPNAGATNGPMPPRFEKPADWDTNAALHPYTSGMGPKPH